MWPSRFQFETEDVPVPATASWFAERLGKKGGGWLYGPLGTGKTYAVRKAVPGGIHVEVTPGALLGQRFAVDLALQLGPDGQSLLQAFHSEGLEASLAIAERAVNGHPLVVDAVSTLFVAASSLDEPAAMIWQDEKKSLLEWLRIRLDRSPTFLVSRQRPRDVDSALTHKAECPEKWPIRLIKADSGYRNWPDLAKLARNNPAILVLARALVPLLSADAFNGVVEQARDDDATPPALLEHLGQAFQASAPPSWQRVLSAVGAVGPIPRDVLEPSLHTGESDIRLEDQRVLDRLRDLKLIEERCGVLSLLPALVDAGAIRGLAPKEREKVLSTVAHRLLAPINDLRSLAPKHADRVLRAHAMFVELGDMGSAERTAALHVHGLVELAKRTSKNGLFQEAWHQYDGVLRMMESGSFCKSDRVGRRILSYVRHYRSQNGSRAGLLDDAGCLIQYQRSLEEWPENALWHQRVVETLVRLARPVEATQAVDRAYRLVEPHPRRDEFLRVRPAGTALREGFSLLALELIEPVLDAPAELFPEVADGCHAIIGDWEKGLPIAELPCRLEESAAEGRIVFHTPVTIYVRSKGDTWVARLDTPAIDGHAERPRAAIADLASRLAAETYRLVSTPSSDLGARDIRVKGRLLSVVDVLNSDVGLHHNAQRWIVGRIDGKVLAPTMRNLPPVEIPDALWPESTQGLYFALVPVYRDGSPSGPATRIEPAGSGRDLASLIELLGRMSEDAA